MISGLRPRGSTRYVLGLFVVSGVLLLSVASSSAAESGARDFKITTLSSHPEAVTGGDALVRIDVPADVPRASVVVTLDDVDVTAKFHWDAGTSRLTGLVDDLASGKNKLRVASTASGQSSRAAHLTIVNFPREGPVFSGARQMPFACEAFILPVFGTTLPKGTEPDCTVDRQVFYFYKPTTGTPVPGTALFIPCPQCPTSYPADVATTTTLEGVTMKYIVRMEVGSANRAIIRSTCCTTQSRNLSRHFTPLRADGTGSSSTAWAPAVLAGGTVRVSPARWRERRRPPRASWFLASTSACRAVTRS